MHHEPTPGTPLFRKLSPENQDKVFQAAVDEFAGKGYRRAPMNSFVRAAGIGNGSPFEYVRLKEDLFTAVVNVAFRMNGSGVTALFGRSGTGRRDCVGRPGRTACRTSFQGASRRWQMTITRWWTSA
jgi:AcrR family transcriptional regulator